MLPCLSLQAIEERGIEITDENLGHETTSTVTCYQNESVEAADLSPEPAAAGIQ
jgi:hypothetical protein